MLTQFFNCKRQIQKALDILLKKEVIPNKELIEAIQSKENFSTKPLNNLGGPKDDEIVYIV